MAIQHLLIPSMYVSKQIAKERQELCNTCPERIAKEPHNINAFSRCPKCKCYIKLKTKLKSEYCPLGDWNKTI